MKTIKGFSFFFTILIISIIALNLSCVQKNELQGKSTIPKTIKYDSQLDAYQELLSGEKDSVVFYSGFVTIASDESGELHSTEGYEEIIIVLEGTGVVRLQDKDDLKLSYGVMAYIPPHSNHQVFNSGVKPLKYIYIATKTK